MQNKSFPVCLVCRWDCNIASLRFALQLPRSTVNFYLFSLNTLVYKELLPWTGEIKFTATRILGCLFLKKLLFLPSDTLPHICWTAEST